jgi:hypothetical protein
VKASLAIRAAMGLGQCGAPQKSKRFQPLSKTDTDNDV